MKTTFFGAAALLLSCHLASAQPPAGKSEAQLMFDKCRTAYGALKSYRGVTRTMDLSLSNGALHIYGGSATITFQQPGLLRVDGKLARGDDFSLLGNAQGSWRRWPLDNQGNWEKIWNLGSEISSFSGVTAGAATKIPLLLIQAPSDRIFRYAEDAKLDGEEKVGGEMCYKITARPNQETISWWINQKTLLLRRIVAYTSEEQSAARLAEIDKRTEAADKKAGREPGPKSEMRLVSRVEDFEIEAIDEPVDEELFVTPAPK